MQSELIFVNGMALPEMLGHGLRTLRKLPLHFRYTYLMFLLREPMAAESLTAVTSLPCE